jgi:hypothetical protein
LTFTFSLIAWGFQVDLEKLIIHKSQNNDP